VISLTLGGSILGIVRKKAKLANGKPIEIKILLGILGFISIAYLFYLIWLQSVVYNSGTPVNILRQQILMAILAYLLIFLAIFKRMKSIWYINVIFFFLRAIYSIYSIVLYYIMHGFGSISSIFWAVVYSIIIVLLFRKRVLFYFRISFRYKLYRLYKKFAVFTRSKQGIVCLIVLIQILFGAKLTYYSFKNLFKNISSLIPVTYMNIYFLSYTISRVFHAIMFLFATVGIIMNKKWGYYSSLVFFIALVTNDVIDLLSEVNMAFLFDEEVVRKTISIVMIGILCEYLVKRKILIEEKKPFKVLLLVIIIGLAISIINNLSLNLLING